MSRYELSTTWTFNYLPTSLVSSINNCLKMLQDPGTDTSLIFSEISTVFIRDGERIVVHNPEERVLMYKHHCIQLVA